MFVFENRDIQTTRVSYQFVLYQIVQLLLTMLNEIYKIIKCLKKETLFLVNERQFFNNFILIELTSA